MLAVAAALLLGAALPAAASAEPVRLMPVGDSITQGSAGDFTWRYRLWQMLQAGADPASPVSFVGDRTGLYNPTTNKVDFNRDYLEPGFDQGHHAFWGRTLVDESGRIAAGINATDPKPTVLAVHLGTNDLNRGAYRGGLSMTNLIKAARRVDPGVDVVIGRLYPLWNGKEQFNVGYVAGFNRVMGDVARNLDTPDERVIVADTDAGFDPETMTWDGRHPTPTGEVRIAAGFADALATLGIGQGALGMGTASPAWTPPTPTPTVTAGNAGQLTARWTASTPGARNYLLQRRDVTADGRWNDVGTFAPSTLSNTSSGLVGGRTYAFRIAPVRVAMVGEPGPSAELVAPTESAPEPPSSGPSRPWWLRWLPF